MMSKKERLEDLGALTVKLEMMDDSPIFELYQGRSKDFSEWFYEQTEEHQRDLLEGLIYGIRTLEEKLCECILIARGHNED